MWLTRPFLKGFVKIIKPCKNQEKAYFGYFDQCLGQTIQKRSSFSYELKSSSQTCAPNM